MSMDGRQPYPVVVVARTCYLRACESSSYSAARQANIRLKEQLARWWDLFSSSVA